MNLLNLRTYQLIVLGTISAWGATSGFGQQGHTLMSRYTFDGGDAYADTSGNNNELSSSSWNSTSFVLTNNAIEGGQAIFFDSYESLAAYCPSHTYDNWMATFYGSFSVSLWLNTTNVVGEDTDDLGYNDQDIIFDFNYNGGGASSTVPIGLTGTKVGFLTVDSNGDYDTLHSTNDVTTGSWFHVVVTRDQSTGVKTIYINGVLDSSEIGTTDHLDGDNNYASIGGTAGPSYVGLLDDVQMYSGVLSAAEVAYLYANPGTALTNVAGPSSGLAAFYDFDEGFAKGATDLSGNGNNLVNGGNFGGPVLSSNAISGSGAVYFNGASFLTPSSNLLSTLAGDFSLSIWVATTQRIGYDGGPPYQGEGIVSADISGPTNDVIPVALEGGAIGFNVGSATNADDWISSATDIDDGNYHHVVVTRNPATGEKQIFIDGLFSSSDAVNAGLLNAPQLLTVGALADGSNPDPTSPSYTGYDGFVGLVDDIQVYSRVLSEDEVSFLHSNPGTNLPDNLVAHYDFDEGSVVAADVSGNGNDMVYAGVFNGPGPQLSTNAESGVGALSFDGTSFLVPEDNLVTNFAGSFSVSVWLQTTQSLGNVGDPAYTGAGIVTAEVANQSYDVIPLALTGGNIAFETDGEDQDVLTSTTSINDGLYHHVVVTRDQASGTKQIYIDGNLDTDDVADSDSLSNPQIVVIGALSDASQSDPNSPTYNGYNGYAGLMDQLQVYSRAISASEVSFLYNNPGATLSATTNIVLNTNFGPALGATELAWTTSGDADWFVETTNTYSTNTAAAQSGSVQPGQSSLLQMTVTGPGTVTFYWQTRAGAGDGFDLEFDFDGDYRTDLSGQTPWQQVTVTLHDNQPHTLTWDAFSWSDSNASPSDAGFLDQVVFTAISPPTITVNPFSQTNYPGYQVALLAAASNAAPPTVWQWYKVGDPNPIPQATNALFIPTNSGSSGVAGGYYATASNIGGSATTATATITFLSAPVPPDWTGAWVSPLGDFDTSDDYYTMATNGYYSCAVDSTGTNVYSSGFCSGSNYYGATLIAAVNGQNAAIIVKQTIAANTPVQWVLAVTNNGNGDAYAEGLALAPGGGIYATGYFSGTNWLGHTLLQDAGQGTFFLGRFDSNGNLVWLTTISNAFTVINGVVADSSGNVTVTGVVNNSTTIGGTNFAIAGQTSFLAQFNSSGTLNWVDHVSNLIEYLAGGGGNIYASLLNYFDGSTNNSIGGITNSTDRNWTIAAVNATNGQGLWLRGVGEAAGLFPGSVIDDNPLIAVSGSNVFLVGTAYGSSAVFGSFTVPITGGRGQYFARYDTNGNAQLVTTFGSPTTQPEAVVADSYGEVYVAGNFDTYSFFGNDVIAGPRFSTLGTGYFGQAFLAKFDNAGAPQWARIALASGGRDEADDMVNFWGITKQGADVWVAGSGSGPVEFGELLPTSNEYINGNEFAFFASGMLGLITDNPPASPVTLIDEEMNGVNFQFSFISTAGHTNYVQYSTGLAGANWLPYSTVVGDGSLKTISVPASQEAEFFRVETQ